MPGAGDYPALMDMTRGSRGTRAFTLWTDAHYRPLLPLLPRQSRDHRVSTAPLNEPSRRVHAYVTPRVAGASRGSGERMVPPPPRADIHVHRLGGMHDRMQWKNIVVACVCRVCCCRSLCAAVHVCGDSSSAADRLASSR